MFTVGHLKILSVFVLISSAYTCGATTETVYSVKLPGSSNGIVAANGMFSGGGIRPLPKQLLCSSKAEANALKASFLSIGMEGVQVSARSVDSSKAPKTPVILRKGNGSLQFNYSRYPDSMSSSTEELRQEAFRFEGVARRASRSLTWAQDNGSFRNAFYVSPMRSSCLCSYQNDTQCCLCLAELSQSVSV